MKAMLKFFFGRIEAKNKTFISKKKDTPPSQAKRDGIVFKRALSIFTLSEVAIYLI